MVISDERVAAVPRRRRRGIGGRRRWSGSEIAATPFLEWKHSGGGSIGGAASARRLAASLWRFAVTTDGGGSVRWQCEDRLGFEFCSSVPNSTFATEEFTKWDYWREWDTASHFHSNVKLNSTAYAKQAELFETRKKVDELEEMASCMRKEHQKMYSLIKNIADGIERERKNCKKIDMMNSKMQRDIADAKLLARRFIQNLEEEKKAREELENICKNLAKEIQGNKSEIGALRNQQRKIQLEVEEERKMLQIAEVWREEQVRMKLTDAELILENKYAHINNLVTDLKALLRRLNLIGDENVTSKEKSLRKGFGSIKNFGCRLPRSDYRISIVKDSQTSETERRSDHCISHDEANLGSQKPEASEISSVSLIQSMKKGLSACKANKPIMINEISDSSKPSTVSTDSRSGDMERDVGRNPHVVRAMKGHVEWPRVITRRGLAANLLKTKIQSQKAQPNQQGS